MVGRERSKATESPDDSASVPTDPTINPNRSWKVIAVLGRPSADKKDFFNSIKFYEVYVMAASRAEAMDRGDPWNNGADLSDGYEVLSYHAFNELGGTV